MPAPAQMNASAARRPGGPRPRNSGPPRPVGCICGLGGTAADPTEKGVANEFPEQPAHARRSKDLEFDRAIQSLATSPEQDRARSHAGANQGKGFMQGDVRPHPKTEQPAPQAGHEPRIQIECPGRPARRLSATCPCRKPQPWRRAAAGVTRVGL
jgi:hypothetical protein